MIENILIVTLIFIVLMLIIELAKEHKKNKYLKKANIDLNIEFGGNSAEGIQLIQKKYPGLNDDWRQSTDEVTSEEFKKILKPTITVVGIPKTREEYFKEPHSIAKGMNDPSDTQKKAFYEEKEK